MSDTPQPFTSNSLKARDTWKRTLSWVAYNCFMKFVPDIGPNRGVFQITLKIRSFLMKQLLCQIGKNVLISHDVMFTNAFETKIGNRTGIGIHSKIGTVIIGNDCMIAEQCLIYSHNHKFNRNDVPIGEQGYDEDKPVIIGDNVWIGGRVTILPGVRIGNGSVVGAGSVVTKNVNPNSVVAGNPARFIRNRCV